MTKIALFIVLCLYMAYNLIVVIKYTPAEMWEKLVTDQNIVGRIAGNIFYTPAWIIKIIYYVLKHYFKIGCQKLWQGIKWLYFSVARFFQQIYHSITDIV